MGRQSKYTLLIICEGKNTEPYFFNSIRDRILEGKYLMNEDVEVHIRPEVEDVRDVEPKNVEYHADDCLGEKCVGGYARRQGYWKETKGKASLFPMIENKLEAGFRNAAWLRGQSDIHAGNTPFYDRNPYVTTDAIVKRLTGYQDQYFEFIPFDKDFDIRGNLLVCFRKDFTVEITNTGENTLIVPAGSITKTLFESGAQQQIGSRIVIKPGGSVNIVFAVSDNETKTAELSFNYGSYHLMLSI